MSKVLLQEMADEDGIWIIAKKLPTALHSYFDWYGPEKYYYLSEEEFEKYREEIEEEFDLEFESTYSPLSLKQALTLKRCKGEEPRRLSTGFVPLDDLLGGGLPFRTLTLLAGEPGAGKSTLSLQLALEWAKSHPVLYVSSEESLEQLVYRARRLGGKVLAKEQASNLEFLCLCDHAFIRHRLKKHRWEVVILDSLHEVRNSLTGGKPGTVRQVTDAAQLIREYSKEGKVDSVCLAIGQINKSQEVAGPEALQHLCDILLFMQGYGTFRTLTPYKNRYGSTASSLSVKMESSGLVFDSGDSKRAEGVVHEGWASLEVPSK